MSSIRKKEDEYLNAFDRTKKLRLNYDMDFEESYPTYKPIQIDLGQIGKEQNQSYLATDAKGKNMSYESYGDAKVTPKGEDQEQQSVSFLTNLEGGIDDATSITHLTETKQQAINSIFLGNNAGISDTLESDRSRLKNPEAVATIQEGPVKILGLPDWIKKK